MISYCVKCQCRRKMVKVKKVVTEMGSEARRGICNECGTPMYKVIKQARV